MQYSDCLDATADLPKDLQQQLEEFLNVLDAEDYENLLIVVGEIILSTEERVDNYWVERAEKAKVLDFLR